jgi:outer membrane protein
MKLIKSIFIALIIFSFTSTYAQETKGKILIGGSSAFGISSTSNKAKTDNDSWDLSKQFDFSFVPMVGFFVINGLAIGLDAEVKYNSFKETSKYSSHYTDKTTTLVAGPFIRYYIGKGKVKPYAHISAGGGQYKEVNEQNMGGTTTYKYSVFAIKAGGGIGIFLNDHVALDLGLQYFYTSSKQKEDNPANGKNLMGNFGFAAGIVVAL